MKKHLSKDAQELWDGIAWPGMTRAAELVLGNTLQAYDREQEARAALERHVSRQKHVYFR